MAGDKSLLHNVTVRSAGRRHACRRNKRHPILKGELMMVIKVDRSEFHYCVACGSKFIATARNRLSVLAAEIVNPGEVSPGAVESMGG